MIKIRVLLILMFTCSCNKQTDLCDVANRKHVKATYFTRKPFTASLDQNGLFAIKFDGCDKLLLFSGENNKGLEKFLIKAKKDNNKIFVHGIISGYIVWLNSVNAPSVANSKSSNLVETNMPSAL